MNRVLVGTAQFGAAYGATNTRGRLTDRAVQSIVAEAIAHGLGGFDTAVAYGDAEQRLGDALRTLAAIPRVVTKLRLDDLDGRDVSDVLAESRRRIGVDQLDVLLHRSDDVNDSAFAALRDTLLEERAAGRVGALGVSVYDEAELAMCHVALPELTLVQVPGSVVDRRLLGSALLAGLAASGVEVHVRSVFLQGLLLLAEDDLPAHFADLRDVIRSLDAQARERSTTRIALVLSAILNDPIVDAIVVGATSAQELRDTLFAAEAARDVTPPPAAIVSDDLVDPRRWRR